MKKKIALAIILLMGQAYMMKADNVDVSDIDNVVYMEPQSFAAGAESTLSFEMKNVVTIIGFQFNLYLPEGVTVIEEEDENGQMVVVCSTEREPERYFHDVKGMIQPDGSVKFIVGGTRAFTGNDGVVLTMPIKVSSEMVQGDYSVFLKNIKLVHAFNDEYSTDALESTITITGVSDGRIHFDETSSVLPEYTTDEKGDVTIQRTIKAGVWNTLVLPFNLTKATAMSLFGSDVQFAQFSGFDVDYGDDEDNVTPLGITLRFSSYTIPARGNLPGGTPILVKVNTPQDITKIEADNVTLASLVTDVNTMDEYGTAGRFTATMVKRVVPADGLFITDNQFWYSTGKTNIKAFRGWFELGAVVGKETDFGAKVRFVIDDVPTAIEGMGADVQEGPIYTLQGMLVGENVDWDTLPRGIYIVNGRKLFKN